MGTTNTAAKKLNWFRGAFRLAKEKDISLNEAKLISEFAMVQNSTYRTAKEMIKMFIDSDEIVRVDGELMDLELSKEIKKEKQKVL